MDANTGGYVAANVAKGSLEAGTTAARGQPGGGSLGLDAVSLSLSPPAVVGRRQSDEVLPASTARHAACLPLALAGGATRCPPVPRPRDPGLGRPRQGDERPRASPGPLPGPLGCRSLDGPCCAGSLSRERSRAVAADPQGFPVVGGRCSGALVAWREDCVLGSDGARLSVGVHPGGFPSLPRQRLDA